METILITGGAGFIGSHVVDTLIGKYKIICVDNFNTYYDPNQKRKNIEQHKNNNDFVLEEADITNKEDIQAIFQKYNPKKIIHLAARAGVRPSLEDPLLYERVNILGTMHLLEMAKKYTCSQFVFGSSSSVYGKNKKVPFSESDNTDFSISPYAATKKAGEVLCYTYHHLYKLNVTCLRFFTVYGPRGRPDMAPYLFTKWISEGKPVTMFGDGTSRRDYTYVADIVQGIVAALEKPLGYEIINLGNSQTVELKHLIATIENLVGKKANIVQKEMPPGDVPITFADVSKAKKLLGYAPTTNIEEGMQQFTQWYNL